MGPMIRQGRPLWSILLTACKLPSWAAQVKCTDHSIARAPPPAHHPRPPPPASPALYTAWASHLAVHPGQAAHKLLEEEAGDPLLEAALAGQTVKQHAAMNILCGNAQVGGRQEHLHGSTGTEAVGPKGEAGVQGRRHPVCTANHAGGTAQAQAGDAS